MSIFHDIQAFAPQLGFTRPWWLLLGIVPFVWIILMRGLNRRRQAQWKQIGVPSTIARMIAGSTRRAVWRTACSNLAGIMLSIALAGPTWGEAASAGVAVGRDFVIAIDVSRSMWADDIQDRRAAERWQAAAAGAKDLVAAARRRGGDRIALVIFAARPLLLSPLTTDYDHIDLKLEAIDARHSPAEVRPDRDDAPSGTRIGAGLTEAVAQHDERFPGYQDIVLFTDADDPAGGREWSAGVSAARAAGIPIHVIGLGDPARDSMILQDGEPLETLGNDGIRSPILTRLNDNNAQAIAAEGRGLYVPARTNLPNLGEFYRTAIRDNSRREISDERRLQPRDRSQGFYAATVLLLTLAWCMPVRRDKVKP